MELAEAFVVEDVFCRSSVDEDSPHIAAVDASSEGDGMFHHGWIGDELLPGECDFLLLSFQGGRHMVNFFDVVQPMLELRDGARLFGDCPNHSARTAIVVIVIGVVWSSVLSCICFVLLQMSLFNEFLNCTPEGKVLLGSMSHVVVERTKLG